LPAGERAAWLDEVCAGQPELRLEVEKLLVSHDADGFMTGTRRGPSVEVELARLKPEEEGELIGRYKLLQEIGQGGFGTVWMAEQKEPVSRRVALKIIKMGMDTREVIGRFEQERQALAMMDHPNIAKVFDAGATPFGRPYFVMELVKGIPITEFCDERQLDTRQRLELFGDVCLAINHAHQKGVIHRDIKPSNVMITLDGDKPVAKVIDFGVAKATQGRLTDKTIYTRFDQFIGTPAYMSPEQATMSGLDIDTRSDIYGLGVLLYELLTGKPPFDAKSLASAGYEEMRRIIREVEPPRPSLRLSTAAGDERTKLARARHIEPAKLSRTVGPDLDWIVMKAIEKDRSRRYETANGLALDIQRFLADEPVRARPPSAGYRFRKFARRNKITLSSGAAVMAALMIGLIAAGRARRAENEESRRRQQAESSQKIAQAELAKAQVIALMAQHFRYAADMNRVQEALESNDIGRARLLLDRHRPANGDLDLRDWEWRYLWEQCRSSAQAMLTKHVGVPIFSESFSPDGTLLLVGDSDGQVELWNVPARKREKLIQSAFGQPAQAVFSPRGENFAVTVGPGVVKTFSVQTGADALLCTVKGHVRDLSYSADGEWLAVLSREPNQLTVLQVADGVPIMNYPLPPGHGMFFNNARISPDKKRIYVSCGAFKEPTVRCVSVPDAQTLWEYPIGVIDQSDPERTRDTGFSAMDLSPKGDELVVATGFQDPEIRVLDPANGRLLNTLKGHTGYVLQVAFSRDGHVLASTSQDQTIRLWDTTTWTRLSAPLRGHNHEVNAVAFSTESHLLATGNKDGEVFLWDTQMPQPAKGRQRLPPHIQTVVPLPVSRMVLGRTSDGKWSLIDLLTLAEEPLPASELSSDGNNPSLIPKEHLPAAISFEKGRLGFHDTTTVSAVSPDGKLLVVASESGEIGFFNAVSLARIEIVRSNLPSVFGVAFSPDGQRLVVSTGGRDGIAVWDALIREELVTLSSDQSFLSGVQFTDDGNTLLVGSTPKGSRTKGAREFWHVPSWNEIEEAERIGGRWPQAEAFPRPAPAPTVGELKTLMENIYRERLAQARAHSPQEVERADEALEDLAHFLRHQNRDADAEPLFRQLLESFKSRKPPDDSAVLAGTENVLSVILAQMQTDHEPRDAGNLAKQTKEADALLDDLLAMRTRMALATPDETFLSLKLGVFQIWFGRKEALLETVRHLFNWAEQRSDDADAMEHAALAWCLSPTNDRSLAPRALELAQHAADLARGPWYEAWYQRTLGLAYYRLGNCAAAESALDRAAEAANDFEASRQQFKRPLQTAVHFIRSMIRFSGGDYAKARELLAEGKAEMKPLPKDRRQIFESATAFDDVMVWLAYKEAEALLDRPADLRR